MEKQSVMFFQKKQTNAKSNIMDESQKRGNCIEEAGLDVYHMILKFVENFRTGKTNL